MTPENGKNDTKYDKKIQNKPTSCLVSDFVPRDFFVGIVMLHECTNFRTCTWNVAWGALAELFIGGACRAIFATPSPETHIRRKFFTSSDACAKFPDFRACLGPLKCD